MKPDLDRTMKLMALVQDTIDFTGQTGFERELRPLAARVVAGIRAKRHHEARTAAAEMLAVAASKLNPGR